MSKELNCRLCALKCPIFRIKSYEQLKNESFDELVKKFLHITLNNDENMLPRSICLSCYDVVSNFSVFYGNVQNAQRILYEEFVKKNLNTECITEMVDESTANIKFEVVSGTDSDSNSINNDGQNTAKHNMEEMMEMKFKEPSENESCGYNKNRNLKYVVVKWKCYKCGRRFHSALRLKEHFHLAHNGDPEYMCSKCKALFSQPFELRTHLREQHRVVECDERKNYICKICEKQYSAIAPYQAHVNSHLGIKGFLCDQCGKGFSLRLNMEAHKYSTCPKREIPLNSPGEDHNVGEKRKEKINRKRQETKHTRRIKESSKAVKKKVFQCRKCKREFFHQSNLIRHEKLHLGRSHACDVCKKAFNSLQSLYRHKIIHLTPTFDCNQCSKKCRTKHLFERHVRTHLSNEEKWQYTCEICNKKFISFDGFDRHKNTHENEQMTKLICDQCGKEFFELSHLKNHLKSHLVEKIYQCDQCPKRFTYERLLQIHKTVHNDSKDYECEECGKRFRLLGILNNHKKTHSINPQYECEHCKKKFKRKYYLKIHLRQHTGEKPYACLECKHYFANDSNFIKHLKGRHSLKNVSIVNQHQYPFVNK